MKIRVPANFDRLITLMIILITGAFLNIVIMLSFYQKDTKANPSHFDDKVEKMALNFKLHIKAYEDILKGAAALYSTIKPLSKDDWTKYIEGTNFLEQYPEIAGVGLIYNIPHENLAQFMSEAQKSISPDFMLHSFSHEENLENHYIVSYVFPEHYSKTSVGYDLASDPTRKIAAETTAFSGNAGMSDSVHLLQDPDHRLGFLILMPIYRQDVPLKTPEDRMKSVEAWVSIPLIAEEFFKTLTKDEKTQFIIMHNQETIFMTEPELKIDEEFNRMEIGILDKSFIIYWKPEAALFSTSDGAPPIWLPFGVLFGTSLICVLILSLRSMVFKPKMGTVKN